MRIPGEICRVLVGVVLFIRLYARASTFCLLPFTHLVAGRGCHSRPNQGDFHVTGAALNNYSYYVR